MKLTLTKLNESIDPMYPNNRPIGEVTECKINSVDDIDIPTVGKCFYVGFKLRTSTVQEIVNKNTFRTHNSIYKWEIVE